MEEKLTNIKIKISNENNKDLNNFNTDKNYIPGINEIQKNELKQTYDMLNKHLKKSEKELNSLNTYIKRKNRNDLLNNITDANEKNNDYVTFPKLNSLKTKSETLENTIKSLRNFIKEKEARVNELSYKITTEKEKKVNISNKLTEFDEYNITDLKIRIKEMKEKDKQADEALKIFCRNSFNPNTNNLDKIKELRILEEVTKKSDINIKNKETQLTENEQELLIFKNKLDAYEEEKKNKRLHNAKIKAEYGIDLQNNEHELLEKESLIKVNKSKNDKKLFLGDLEEEKLDELSKIGIKKDDDKIGWYNLNLLNPEKLNEIDDFNNNLERIIIEKGEIANNLEKAQNLIETHKELKDKKDQLRRVQLAKLEKELEDYETKLYEKKNILMEKHKELKNNEVVYDSNETCFKNDDEFDEDIENNGYNYFEIYFEDLQFNLNYFNEEIPTILFTVDFYNNETFTSNLFKGIKIKLNTLVSFELKLNENLLNYLINYPVNIEIFTNKLSNHKKLGNSNLYLNEFIKKNIKYSEKQLNGSCVLKNKLSLVNEEGFNFGNITCTYRMKKPFGINAKILNIDFDKELKSKEMNIIIKIDKLKNIDINKKVFINYFLFNNYYTDTYQGENIDVRYKKVHNIILTKELINFIKNEKLELLLFDDNVPTEEENDLIGKLSVDLAPLLNNEVIKIKSNLLNYYNSKKIDTIIEMSIYNLSL